MCKPDTFANRICGLAFPVLLDEGGVAPKTSGMLNQVEYYKTPAVRQRIAEYCGGDSADPDQLTAEYLVGYGEALVWEGNGSPFRSMGPSGFNYILDKGLDFFRSNWDTAGTLGIIDVEYFNMDYSGEIYLKPERCFGLVEPVRETIEATLTRFGIPFIEIMTGQGYHFSLQAPRGSAADFRLVDVGRVSEAVAGKYGHPTGRRAREVTVEHGRSFDGMGRLMEYVMHLVLFAARGRSPLPVVTTDAAVPRGRVGREGISLDLSMYGDPLHMRDIRVPFSTHQKHKVMRDKVGERIASTIPVQICFPIGPIPLNERLRMRRHFRWASEWADSCGSMKIPDAGEGLERLADDYETSRLQEFHKHWDSTEHDPWTEWSKTYDQLDLNSLPGDMADILRNPNPKLLQPTNLRNLTKTLIHRGWHPKHIAGLVRSKYERDYGWDENWSKYDASMRADFYVRLFAGQVWVGLDR